MTKNLDKIGLSSIADNYQLFYIDLWGVVHNGVNLHDEAINVLKQISNKNKDYILLTNAPRPNNSVKKFLEKMGMEKEMRDHVFTSGEAALNYLKKNFLNKSFFHVGPPRDFDLFKDFEQNKLSDIQKSEYILCTGLFDDHDKDLVFYKNLFEKHLKKKMICTNPDLIVDRGDVREFCAGSLAKIFEKLGGEVKYFGKPHPEIYKKAFSDLKNKKVICIGDSLNTDIKGANIQNFDSLLITSGIHKNEISNGIEKLVKKHEVNVNYIQKDLKW